MAFSSWIPNPYGLSAVWRLSNLGRAKPPLLARPSSSSPRFLLAFLPLPASTSHAYCCAGEDGGCCRALAPTDVCAMCVVHVSTWWAIVSITTTYAAAHIAPTKVSACSCISPSLTPPAFALPASCTAAACSCDVHGLIWTRCELIECEKTLSPGSGVLTTPDIAALRYWLHCLYQE